MGIELTHIDSVFLTCLDAVASTGSSFVHHHMLRASNLMQDAEAAAKAAEEKAAQDEIERQQRIKDSFDAQMPDEISQKVQAALQKEMVGCF